MIKNDSRITRAWCVYDLANSVYSLSISTAIFPVYYASVIRENFGESPIPFFSWSIPSGPLYSWALSFSFLLIALLSPFLSGIADAGGKKKAFMKAFTYLGAAACAGLFFFDGSNPEWGILCAVLASIGFAGSLVFYNAFLPQIATPDQYDRISANGFMMGYAGSVILLIFSLIAIMFPAGLGLEGPGQATRLSFLAVGLWWAGFAQITFRRLPESFQGSRPGHSGIFSHGYRELAFAVKQSFRISGMRAFLASYFSYILGVITIIYLATLFAEGELKMTSQQLIIVILILQVVAIVGAWLFARISARIGNRNSLMIMVGIWMLVCVAAYAIGNATQFFVLAMVVGLVLGGIQSLSRSSFAKLIPEGTHAPTSFFSFFDVTEKLATVTGTFVFGLVNFLTGSMRYSALSLALFFLLGFFGLIFVKIPKQS